MSWLFVLTLPNSGSTALAQLLASAPGTGMLTSTAEGQWLVPELSERQTRWDPDLPINYDRVRRRWFKKVSNMDGVRLVIEKSPPTLCRAASFLSNFADLQRTVISFSRDPYAVCASWVQRYSLRQLNFWLPELPTVGSRRPEFLRMVGDLCGHRTRMLVDSSGLIDLALSYEHLCADPAEALAELMVRRPELAGIDVDARLSVKDRPPQPLENMNASQISTLSDEDIEAISDGLRPHREAVEQAGYALR